MHGELVSSVNVFTRQKRHQICLRAGSGGFALLEIPHRWKEDMALETLEESVASSRFHATLSPSLSA